MCDAHFTAIASPPASASPLACSSCLDLIVSHSLKLMPRRISNEASAESSSFAGAGSAASTSRFLAGANFDTGVFFGGVLGAFRCGSAAFSSPRGGVAGAPVLAGGGAPIPPPTMATGVWGAPREGPPAPVMAEGVRGAKRPASPRMAAGVCGAPELPMFPLMAAGVAGAPAPEPRMAAGVDGVAPTPAMAAGVRADGTPAPSEAAGVLAAIPTGVRVAEGGAKPGVATPPSPAGVPELPPKIAGVCGVP